MREDAPVRGRALTWFAVGFLTLDGVLLLLAGLWGRRGGVALGGAACLAAAGGVILMWRRHRRALVELREARKAVAEEARALRALIRQDSPGER